MIEDYLGYMVKPSKVFPSHLSIATVGQGGKIPNVLSGLFTSYKEATRAIDSYIADRPVKEKTDGKATSKAGS